MQTTYQPGELADYGLLKVSGGDAKKLLQGQLTCDLEKLKLGETTLAAHCNPQGRIISLFYLFIEQDAYYLLIQRSMIALTLNALKKYAIFYKTELVDVSDHFIISGETEIHKTGFHFVKLPSKIERGFLIQNRKETTAPSQASSENWKYLNIQDGLATLYPQTSGKFLPHELNLIALDAVSFDKGCYTGQEIIARMQYRGKLKTALYTTTLQTEIPPLLGSDVSFTNDQGLTDIGILVDACEQEDNQYYALIIARKS